MLRVFFFFDIAKYVTNFMAKHLYFNESTNFFLISENNEIPEAQKLPGNQKATRRKLLGKAVNTVWFLLAKKKVPLIMDIEKRQ